MYPIPSLCAASILGAALFAATVAWADPAQDVRAASAAFAEALNASETAAVQDMHTGDALVMPPDNRLFEGSDGAAAQWQGMFDAGVTGVVLEILAIDVFGDHANEYGLWTATAPDGAGGTVPINGKYVHI